jgi:hypothetical protein
MQILLWATDQAVLKYGEGVAQKKVVYGAKSTSQILALPGF